MKKNIMQFLMSLFLLALGLSGSAVADMHLEVVGVGNRQLPIAIVPFQYDLLQSQPISPVVESDLSNSGLFRVVRAGHLVPVPYEPQEVNYPLFIQSGAQTVLLGRVNVDGDKIRVIYYLVDLASRKVLLSQQREGPLDASRRIAHRIADDIYQILIGEPGIFTSRIAYVLSTHQQHQLQVSDYDGFGAQTLLSSKQPIMSPKWSPDGTTLAYVSFEQHKPIIYLHQIYTGKRQVLAGFFGSNAAPAWSPDGQYLAVVLSKEGGSQIFLINKNGSGLHRLTRVGEINTEPAFSPDGQSIIFTSDRGGSPQIYRTSVLGNHTERITMQGSYNASAKISPNGRLMTYITRDNGKFKVAVMDLSARQSTILTDTQSGDSPSFSPNGRLILYETTIDQRSGLAVTSVDGRVKQELKPFKGWVRQPAWGPSFN